MSKYDVMASPAILRFVDAGNRLQFLAPEDDARWDSFDSLQEMLDDDKMPPEDLLALFEDIPVIDVQKRGRLGSFSIPVEMKSFGPRNTKRPPWL